MTEALAAGHPGAGQLSRGPGLVVPLRIVLVMDQFSINCQRTNSDANMLVGSPESPPKPCSDEGSIFALADDGHRELHGSI